MKKVGKFEVYSMEEVLDEALGPIGTPDRDLHERQVAEAVHDYHILSSKSEDITEINDAII